MTRWPLQEANEEFSRLVECARAEGPQLVTKNGTEVAVVLDIEEYRRLSGHGGDFKKFLESFPDVELPIERSRELATFPELF